jgi:hypothetical protein
MTDRKPRKPAKPVPPPRPLPGEGYQPTWGPENPKPPQGGSAILPRPPKETPK